MKYLISLLLGMICGVAILGLGLLYNPFASQGGLSPITVSDAETFSLTYSNVANTSLTYTNNGESRTKPYPAKVLQLWEPSVRQSTAMATALRDSNNRIAGLGVKMSSPSEKTDLLNGKALIDSVWYIYVPGRGSFFIEQQENYWGYLRDIVVPAYRNSANTWKGNWMGDISDGPGSLQTAHVTSTSDSYDARVMLGLESLRVHAWSVNDGTIAAEGRLTVELPRKEAIDIPIAE